MSQDGTTVQGGEQHVIIKKYANRKFYNTRDSHYESFDGIRKLVANGASVIVIDNVSKRDITDQTLAAVLVENISETKALSLTEIVELIKRSTAKTETVQTETQEG